MYDSPGEIDLKLDVRERVVPFAAAIVFQATSTGKSLCSSSY